MLKTSRLALPCISRRNGQIGPLGLNKVGMSGKSAHRLEIWKTGHRLGINLCIVVLGEQMNGVRDVRCENKCFLTSF